MCRIWGVSYATQEEVVPLPRMALVLNRFLVRGGPHAWGWFGMEEKSGTIYSQKSPGRVDTVVAEDSYLSEIESTVWRWMVGHVRYATNGAPGYNGNNHPLQHGHIMGVHNGVLINHDDILKVTGRVDKEAIVDSEAIFAAVNRWGHAPGLRKIIGDMVAIYADVRKPNLLHLARTYNRSLHIGFTERGNIIFASEREALYALEDIGVKFGGFSTIQEMRHLVLKDGKIIHRHTFGEVPEGARKAPKAKPIPSGFTLLPSSSLRPLPYDDLFLDNIPDQFGTKVDDDTYYYKGRLMSGDEYVDAVVSDMEWERN